MVQYVLSVDRTAHFLFLRNLIGDWFKKAVIQVVLFARLIKAANCHLVVELAIKRRIPNSRINFGVLFDRFW